MRLLMIWAWLILSLSALAQNWSPLNCSEKMNYSATGFNYITNTIRIDSAKVSGADSVFYLNRIVTPCDTCPATYRLCNQPDFLKKNMYKRSGGTYEFRYPGSIVIKTLATTGQSWVYDTAGSVTATVFSKTTTQVFGENDSVKEIHLSNGGILKLSKNHGLLLFTGNPGNLVYTLIGIEGRNLGDLVPRFAQIYNYQVGDVFQYHDKSIYYSPGGIGHEHLTKITILSKDSLPGQYTYGIRQITCGWWVDINGFTGDTTHSYQITSLGIQDSAADFSNYYPLQIVENAVDPSISGNTACYFQTGLDNQGIYTKWIGDGNFFDGGVYAHGTEFTPPLPYELLVPMNFFAYLNSFKNGLGNTYTSLMVGEAFSLNELIGYVKNSDTVGTVYPDDFILAGVKDGSTSEKPAVYPNPCIDKISITGISRGEIAGYSVSDSFGRLIMTGKFHNTLDVSSLRSGVYFLCLSDARNGMIYRIPFIRL